MVRPSVALASPQPSSGGYFKARESRGSRLRSDPVDGHEEFSLSAQPRGGIRRLEELLSHIDRAAIEDQGNPERLIVLEAASDHLSVSRLEHVQRQRGLRKQDRMEREERDTHARQPSRGKP